MNRSNPSGAMKAFFSSPLRRGAALIAGLVLLVAAQEASAYCELNTAGGYIPKNINMVMGRIVVSPDLPVGSLITPAKSFPIYQAGATNTPFTCTSGGGTLYGVINSAAVGAEWSGKEKVFATSVPGIGIRLLRIGSGDSRPEVPYPHTLPTSTTFGPFSTNSSFVVELYKIAPITGSGRLINGIYTTYSGDRGGSAVTTRVDGDAITIVTPSCLVDTGSKNIPVVFGKVPQSDFKGRGTTAAERNFNIRLKCNAGVGTQNTVYLRMDATPDPAGDAGVLRISQASGSATATGVGIQIIDGQKVPVKYGDDALVGPSKDGDYVLPYTARYFQTGNTVTPGQANGMATFTLDYK
jgi:type 1 fimbria pilin